jgi:hypothetical protein
MGHPRLDGTYSTPVRAPESDVYSNARVFLVQPGVQSVCNAILVDFI